MDTVTTRRAKPSDSAALADIAIGRLLMAVAEDHARTTSKEAVRLYTNAVMLENARLYEHLGYVEVGRRMQDGFDRVFFEKELTRLSG